MPRGGGIVQKSCRPSDLTEVTIGSGDVENNEGSTSFSKSLLPEQLAELRGQRVRSERIREIERDTVHGFRRFPRLLVCRRQQEQFRAAGNVVLESLRPRDARLRQVGENETHGPTRAREERERLGRAARLEHFVAFGLDDSPKKSSKRILSLTFSRSSVLFANSIPGSTSETKERE